MKKKPIIVNPIITKEQFIKMNKNRRRVFLAKDVLAQLQTQKYIKSHCYFDFDWVRNKREPESAKDLINNEGRSCYVCAKGALTCSYVRHMNKYTVDDLKGSVDLDEMYELFGEETWERIEALYEGWELAFDGTDYKHDMEAIMQNIIRNAGELTL